VFPPSVDPTRGLRGTGGVRGKPGTAGDLESKTGRAGGGEYLEPMVERRLRGLLDGERCGCW
jgi:hypothetical protein